MGNIYSPPEEVGDVPQISDFRPDGRFDCEGLEEAEKEWEEELRAWCRKYGKGKYVGEIVKEPVADGYALYMVLSLNPVELIHIPFGDAYQFRWANRWTASDIKSMLKMEKELRAIFN